MAESRIKIGGLKGPHGLQGWVKAKLFLADTAMLQGQALQLESGVSYTVQALKPVGQGLLALQLKGITSPEQAAALKGPLYLPKEALNLSDDEVLLSDLLGQPLLGPDGEVCGTISGVTELPAGPALQVKLPDDKPKTALVPLEAAFIELSGGTPPQAKLTPFGLQLLSL
jgi:ribosomal 30S subunit maturation factor RimM